MSHMAEPLALKGIGPTWHMAKWIAPPPGRTFAGGRTLHERYVREIIKKTLAQVILLVQLVCLALDSL